MDIRNLQTAVLMAQLQADSDRPATPRQIEEAMAVVERGGNPIMVCTQFELALSNILSEDRRMREKARRRFSLLSCYWAYLRHLDRLERGRKNDNIINNMDNMKNSCNFAVRNNNR